ncbi:MAG: hypothetical protein EOP53_07755 [Sphingobacteriales bacterium]|nr:MAG: hypothetical protein EOP53_07755 [Sphingobacteriales bacterium]
MKILPTRIHGMTDYMTGVLLIAAPWLFGFSDNTAATYVPIVLGAGIILYSLITDYEMGIARIISMRTHLILDLLGGAFLAASPWLFNFDERVYLPHLIVGLMEIAVTLITETRPRRAYNSTDNAKFRNRHSAV